MINVPEPPEDKEVVFASPVHFERSGAMKERYTQLTFQEKDELCYHLLTQMEDVFGASEVMTNKLADLLGWRNVM